MRWHNDDERGLAPTVASLSLGADCMMDFRLSKALTVSATQKALLSIKLHHVGPVLQSHMDVMLIRCSALLRAMF